MAEQVTCPCGVSKSSVVGTPRWIAYKPGSLLPVDLTALRDDGTAEPAYCPRCGAGLSLDAQGAPVVQARVAAPSDEAVDIMAQIAKAAISRAVQEERERVTGGACVYCALGYPSIYLPNASRGGEKQWYHPTDECGSASPCTDWGRAPEEADDAE